jgi:hypothetical protein
MVFACRHGARSLGSAIKYCGRRASIVSAYKCLSGRRCRQFGALSELLDVDSAHSSIRLAETLSLPQALAAQQWHEKVTSRHLSPRRHGRPRRPTPPRRSQTAPNIYSMNASHAPSVPECLLTATYTSWDLGTATRDVICTIHSSKTGT